MCCTVVKVVRAAAALTDLCAKLETLNLECRHVLLKLHALCIQRLSWHTGWFEVHKSSGMANLEIGPAERFSRNRAFPRIFPVAASSQHQPDYPNCRTYYSSLQRLHYTSAKRAGAPCLLPRPVARWSSFTSIALQLLFPIRLSLLEALECILGFVQRQLHDQKQCKVGLPQICQNHPQVILLTSRRSQK